MEGLRADFADDEFPLVVPFDGAFEIPFDGTVGSAVRTTVEADSVDVTAEFPFVGLGALGFAIDRYSLQTPNSRKDWIGW